MQRLNRNNLDDLPAEVLRPPAGQDPAGTIVHLGIGAFHRAHQAVYTQHANAGPDQPYWQIIGASLRSGGVRDQLVPQDCYYTVATRDDGGERHELIGVLDEVLVGPESPAALIDAMANPLTRIISLTVTEKGYCHLPDSGDLNLQHPDIHHDLQYPGQPRTAVGFVVAALARRRRTGTGGVTVLSCDNLPDNGRLSKNVILQLARQQHDELADWIETHVSFPSTMVDRIVPAPRDADRQSLARQIGLEDQAMVVCEPFTQWVIEDDFVNGRPAWETAGALLVADVTPFEHIKLRLLNGSHSSMAYLGVLCGYDYMHQVIADPSLEAFITYLMDEEMSPTLEVPAGFDIDAYKVELCHRFANSALQHRTVQVAMDGTQKLPQRLLQPLRLQLDCGRSIEAISLAVAAWMRYVSTAEHVDDPLAEQISQHCKGQQRPHDLALALLQMDCVFSADLPASQRFVDRVCHWLERLAMDGAAATAAGFAATQGPGRY